MFAATNVLEKTLARLRAVGVETLPNDCSFLFDRGEPDAEASRA
jgi:hypothetical protein